MSGDDIDKPWSDRDAMTMCGVSASETSKVPLLPRLFDHNAPTSEPTNYASQDR